MTNGSEVRPRPPVLRALGKSEPPPHIDVDGCTYQLQRVVKHDSWAATAFYAAGEHAIVCKFNRQQRVGILPLRWLGRWLARREGDALRRLAGLAGIPPALGDVYADGALLRHAVAHVFIPGRPLGKYDRISSAAFADLEMLLAEVHNRDMAYVDLHKRENILVGDDGRLYLLDFQIGFTLKSWWPANSLPVRLLLRMLQHSDRYHLGKHVARCGATATAPARPWWIRVHRCFAVPFRESRRWLLVKLGVRGRSGQVDTEFFPEEVVRADREAKRAA